MRPEIKGQDVPFSVHGCPFTTTTGFITMTPQLFINYKLKSVAHLPWRMLTYKALNTFIDDLFAFVIKMPVMYRIGCLRDGEAWRAAGREARSRATGGPDPGPGLREVSWPQACPGTESEGLGQSLQDSSPHGTVGQAGRSRLRCPLTPPPDVVFFIYLYQRWIYRVDPTRVNEFGMSGEAPTAAIPVAEARTAPGHPSTAPIAVPATTSTAAAREEASTPLLAKPTQGVSSAATKLWEVPPKPVQDKKRD